MKLSKREIRFLKKQYMVKNQVFFNNPLRISFIIFSYSVPLIKFYIGPYEKSEFYNYIFMTLYWFAGLFLGYLLLWDQKMFMGIISKLSPNDHNDTEQNK